MTTNKGKLNQQHCFQNMKKTKIRKKRKQEPTTRETQITMKNIN